MGWKNDSLSNLCEMYQPKTISKKMMVKDGKYLVYGANGVIGYYDQYNHDTPQLLITCRGATCGSVNTTKGKVWINGNAMVVAPKDERLDLRYLEYVFLGGINISSAISGAAQPQITREGLSPLIVHYPPITEQKRIVSILDTVFADLEQARVKTEQNLKNARELFDSYLQQVFSQKGEGWEDKRLDDICTFSSGGTPSKQNDNFWNGDIPWVSGRDMKSTQLSDTFLHISQRAIDEGSSRIAPKGTLLTLVRGMGLAHGAQVTELMVPSAFNQDIKGIHLKANIVPRYLVFVLRKKINSSADIISSAAHGTLKINMDALRNIVVPVPPKKEQKYIVDRLNAFIESVDNLQFIYQEKLNAIDELKKSILQKAFSGELTNTVE